MGQRDPWELWSRSLHAISTAFMDLENEDSRWNCVATTNIQVGIDIIFVCTSVVNAVHLHINLY